LIPRKQKNGKSRKFNKNIAYKKAEKRVKEIKTYYYMVLGFLIVGYLIVRKITTETSLIFREIMQFGW
jgi:hypothetical protein